MTPTKPKITTYLWILALVAGLIITGRWYRKGHPPADPMPTNATLLFTPNSIIVESKDKIPPQSLPTMWIETFTPPGPGQPDGLLHISELTITAMKGIEIGLADDGSVRWRRKAQPK